LLAPVARGRWCRPSQGACCDQPRDSPWCNPRAPPRRAQPRRAGRGVDRRGRAGRSLTGRLATEVEVAAILRSVSADGGFATVIRKGEAERGALLLLISSRGQHVTCLERVLAVSGEYRWQRIGPRESASS